MDSDAAPRAVQPAPPPKKRRRGPSLPLALILLGVALNLAWLGLLGWAIVRAVLRLA